MATSELEAKIGAAIKEIDQTGDGSTLQGSHIDIGIIVARLNQGQDNAPKRKEIEAALRSLEEKGNIVNRGGRYQLVP